MKTAVAAPFRDDLTLADLLMLSRGLRVKL